MREHIDQMKALLYTKPYTLGIAEVLKPKIAEAELLIKIKACGICGSDVHGYTGKTGRRIPPLIMGHEASGVVEKIGSKAKGKFYTGQRVTFDSTIFCNDCVFCRSGMINHCINRQVFGVASGNHKRDGAFAEYIAAPWWIIYPIPDTLSFENAAMLEPAAVAVHALNRTPVRINDTVVVIGAGTIGLFTIQAVKLKGAGRVVAIDTNTARLKIAGEWGADLALDPKNDDIGSVIKDLTDGLGADVVLDAVGLPATVNQAIEIVRNNGQLTLIGNITSRIELTLQAVVAREINIQGTYASAGEHRDCIDLFTSGKINPAPILSQVLPLLEGPKAFEKLLEPKSGLLKVVLIP